VSEFEFEFEFVFEGGSGLAVTRLAWVGSHGVEGQLGPDG
jgi:hypothetical protein